MLTALYIMLGLALTLGVLLGISALMFKVEGDPLVARIDAILRRPSIARDLETEVRLPHLSDGDDDDSAQD